MDTELEATVQRMIDAGEKDETINKLIDNWDALHSASQEAPAAPESAPAESRGLPPGVLTGAGALVATANDTVRPAMAMAAKGVEKISHFPRLLGASVGASVGGKIGATVDQPFGGAALGGALGGAVGNHIAGPVAAGGRYLVDALGKHIPRVTIDDALKAEKAVQAMFTRANEVANVAPKSSMAKSLATAAKAAEAAMPKVGRMLPISAGRKIANMVGGKALPVVGQGMMLLDAYNAMRGYAEPISKGLANRPEGNPVDDPLVQELMTRWKTRGE